MTGDHKKRHCCHCDLDVHNFAEMTRAEIEALVVESNGRMCARLFKRADGTVLTADCPVGLAAVRAKSRLMIARAVACTAALFSASILLAESGSGEHAMPALSRYQPFKWAYEQLAPSQVPMPMGLVGKISAPRGPDPTIGKDSA